MRLLVALVVALSARAALACSVCAGGDPLAAAGEQPSRSHEVRAALETEWLTVRSASEDVPGADTVLDQYTLRAIGVYSPLDDLNLAVTVPLVVKRLSTDGGEAGHDAHRHAGSETGLGDVEVGARWFVVDRTDFSRMVRHALSLSVGTSLPTGANDRREDGVRLDEHAQLGTGAFGPYAGVGYRLQGDRWTASASTSGRWRTVNRFGYRSGEALTWAVGTQWKATPRVAMSFGVDGRLAQRDRQDRVFVPDTGGLALLAAPGVHFDAGGGAWLSLRAQVPFYTHLYGEQSVGPTVVAGLQYQLR